MSKKDYSDAEPIISDGNFDYFNKNPEDYKGVVLQTINNLRETQKKLLTSSGIIWVNIGGQYVKQEENTLKIYFQQIEFLEDLLLFFFDDEVKETIEEQDKLRKEVFKKYFDLFVSKQMNESKKYRVKLQGIIPQEEALGKWCHEQIEEETKQNYRKKLQALLLLFKRKNELSGKRTARMGM